jgi:hypothetical protein
MTDEVKYLANGRMVRVLSTLPDGASVVELGHEDYDQEADDNCELIFEGTQIVRKVFDKPPRDALDKEIAVLLGRASDLRQEVAELSASRAEVEREQGERFKLLAQFAPLVQIERFMRGEITHYVTECSASVAILTVEDARNSNESRDVWDGRRYQRPLRMLQLFGDPRRRDVEWRLASYSDGSGHGELCYPCISEGDARAKATEILNAKVAELMAKEGYMHGGNYLIESARKLDLVLPAAFLERWKAYEAKSLADSIAVKEKELSELKARQVPA